MNKFKNRGDLKTDELRRRREDAAIEIRKQKREENFAKRRNLQFSALDSDDDLDENFNVEVSSIIFEFLFVQNNYIYMHLFYFVLMYYSLKFINEIININKYH